jgi:hypothetical protein
MVEIIKENNNGIKHKKKKTVIKTRGNKRFFNPDLPTYLFILHTLGTFFQFNIYTDTFKVSPFEWLYNDNLKKFEQILISLKVVNDVLEITYGRI